MKGKGPAAPFPKPLSPPEQVNLRFAPEVRPRKSRSISYNGKTSVAALRGQRSDSDKNRDRIGAGIVIGITTGTVIGFAGMRMLFSRLNDSGGIQGSQIGTIAARQHLPDNS